jgi:hypothetical protein
MGFYGMLIAVVFISLLVLSMKDAIAFNMINESAYAFNMYANRLSLDSFYMAATQTIPYNSLQYGNWLNAVEACAQQDSINIYIDNSIIVISNRKSPGFSKAFSPGNV